MKIFMQFDNDIHIDAITRIFINEKEYRENVSIKLIDIIRSIFLININIIDVKKNLFFLSMTK